MSTGRKRNFIWYSKDTSGIDRHPRDNDCNIEDGDFVILDGVNPIGNARLSGTGPVLSSQHFLGTFRTGKMRVRTT